MMRYVNLGCGNHYHPDWINIDIVATGPAVIAHDLSHGIPLPTNSCDVVYHSHILEHLRQENSFIFLQECHRVLKPGGIIRVAVPDLEVICRLYLEKLEACLADDKENKSDYEWMMIEMYDQTVREQSGGKMKEYLEQDQLLNEDFVYARIGEEAKQLVASLKQQMNVQSDIKHKILSYNFHTNRKIVLDRGIKLLAKIYQRLVAHFLLGKKAVQALEIGDFRLSGEVHQWMYDQFSLKQILLDVGFKNPIRRAAHESAIPSWSSFALDTLPDGAVRKPDSLFMEANKPS
jgi:predicted SAM-dependent methyltransferase